MHLGIAGLSYPILTQGSDLYLRDSTNAKTLTILNDLVGRVAVVARTRKIAVPCMQCIRFNESMAISVCDWEILERSEEGGSVCLGPSHPDPCGASWLPC